ncbi:efflux RND transporter permease subunit, partial [Salmonella enterica subsp. enterica serovar Lubbock]|nr:efflux RND transporter permease subunit [Salmonella enterica subsp. enterica serovar Lubbock]
NFFIDRPIFAWVLAILLCLTGALAIFSLPVEQYPDLAPPNVRRWENGNGMLTQLNREFPTVSLLDIGAILKQVGQVLEQVSRAL